MKSDDTRKKISRNLFLSCGGIIIVGICAVVFVFINSQKASDVIEVDKGAEWAALDSRNYTGIYTHGGSYEKLKELYSFVGEYIDYMQKGNFELLFETYYDQKCLNANGYKMSKDKFVEEMQVMADRYHMLTYDPKRIDVSYTADTYMDYTNFYIYIFHMQFTYYDDSGIPTQSPVVEYTYTVIPYTTKDNTVYYKLLDFNLNDLGTQVTRLEKLEN